MHYFEVSDGDTSVKMYGEIQAGSLKFIISCKETDDCKDSLALTDAKPNKEDFTAKIRLCPKFFNDDRSKFFLISKGLKRNPGRRDNLWCQIDKLFTFFETASHTFLYEMTYLDQLGK